MTIRSYWYNGTPNFGDEITPWLVERITGNPAEWVPPTDSRMKLYAVGSVLSAVRAPAVVWGTGAMTWSDMADPSADYRAVRGPLTAKRIEVCGGTPPAAFGDPALLLPRWIDPEPKQYRLGIVPHYIHLAEVRKRFGEPKGVLIVDVGGGVEAVTKQITACEVIASSSLHGLIVACAYGIPHVQLQFTAPLCGDGSKFSDFYAGIGATRPALLDCRTGDLAFQDIQFAAAECPAVDDSALWAACPIQELDT
jgi:pyruvyltransferase